MEHVGGGGPIHVEHAAQVSEVQPFREALEKAWVSKGGKMNQDIYSGKQFGLVKCMNSIYKGFRSSSYTYVENKSNITIMSSTHSKKLIIEDKVAKGVVVQGTGGEELSFFAKKEVIVSSGVFETPKLLLLSGIGPKEELAAWGIDAIVDSPHVGKNLLDHPIFSHVFELKDGVGLDNHLLRAGPEKEGSVMQYKEKKTGPLASGLLELIGLPRIDEYLMKDKDYVEYKKNNGGIDPFGPEGQPHFEIDFVVSLLPQFLPPILLPLN